MKTRRWLRYAIALLVALMIAAVVWYLVIPHPQINMAIWKKIAVGMEKGDVETLMNAPPGDYSSGFGEADCILVHDPAGFGHFFANNLKDPRSFAELRDRFLPLHSSAWWGRRRALFVFYDNHDRVKFKAFASCNTPPSDRVGRLVFWLDSWFEKQEKE